MQGLSIRRMPDMAKESRNSGHSLQSQGGFDYNGRRKRRGAVRSGREEYTKMIDINLIRKNPDVVRENIRKKFQDSKLVLVDEVIELDRANREAMQKAGINYVYMSTYEMAYSFLKTMLGGLT